MEHNTQANKEKVKNRRMPKSWKAKCETKNIHSAILLIFLLAIVGRSNGKLFIDDKQYDECKPFFTDFNVMDLIVLFFS